MKREDKKILKEEMVFYLKLHLSDYAHSLKYTRSEKDEYGSPIDMSFDPYLNLTDFIEDVFDHIEYEEQIRDRYDVNDKQVIRLARQVIKKFYEQINKIEL